jgi:LCP family protein required for cell wall assembly
MTLFMIVAIVITIILKIDFNGDTKFKFLNNTKTVTADDVLVKTNTIDEIQNVVVENSEEITKYEPVDEKKFHPYSGELLKSDNKIQKFAFFGVDSRKNTLTGASDSLIVFSVNTDEQIIRMVSMMRDLKVYVNGIGYTKLGYGYSGGSWVALNTLKENYGLDLEDYITTNFLILEEVVKALGGVDIELTPDEVKGINAMTRKKIRIKPDDSIYTLGSEHALIYSRMRSIGEGDFDRTWRQRSVIKAMLKKINELESEKLIEIIKYIGEMADTNMDIGQFYDFVADSGRSYSTQTMRFPSGNQYTDGIESEIYLITLKDSTEMIEELHKFLNFE